MRIYLLIILIFISISGLAQISVGPTHIGKAKKFDKNLLTNFKKSKTIFVLSEVLDRGENFEIIEKSWNVTPYEIVQISDFDIEEYLNGNYSFVQLGGYRKYMEMGNAGYSTLYTYLDIIMYDIDKINKKLNKLTPEKKEKKKSEIIAENEQKIARFYIYPKDDFIKTTATKSIDEIFTSLYTDDVFYNYKPGFLLNYFQQIDELLQDEKIYWLYENDYKKELKNLASKTLYIPEYLNFAYNMWTAEDIEQDEKSIQDLFKKYDFQYKFIDDDELSEKIMNNENLYYLRYVRMNTERFLQVVNATNGEIVYRSYIPGLSFKIKTKHIKELSRSVSRALKK